MARPGPRGAWLRRTTTRIWTRSCARATAGLATRSAIPACPDLEDRAKLVDLLEPERIGVELSEEFQLHPEQSTDAIVVHHPEAKYFNAK